MYQSGAIWAVTAAQVAVTDTVGVYLVNKKSRAGNPGGGGRLVHQEGSVVILAF